MSQRPRTVPATSAIVERLGELSLDDDIETSDLPPVQVILRNGAALDGRVVAVERGERILLATNTEGGPFTTVLIDEIVAFEVALSDATETLFGQPPQRREGPPTKLGLKRRVKSIGEKFGDRLGHNIDFEVPWDDLPTGDEGLADVATIIDQVDGSLTVVLSDELGKSALANMTTIALRKGKHVGVEVDDRRMSILVRVLGKRASVSKDLTAAIESEL